MQCVYAGVGWTKLEFKRLYIDNESKESANNGGNKNERGAEQKCKLRGKKRT